MATYRLRRKRFGIVGSTVGGVTETAGNVMNSTVGKAAGAAAGANLAGDAIGGVLEAAGVPGAGALGKITGAVAGWKAAGTLGKNIADAGSDMTMKSQLS